MTAAPTAEAPAPSEPVPSLMTREFATLMATASMFFLALGSLNALLAKFVVDDLGGTEATAGFVMGSAAFSALATRIWFGRTADRNGARRILVMGALLGALSFVILALSTTVAMAMASRLVMGAAGAAVVTGATMLGIQLAPEARRSQATALVLVSFHAGMGLGPLFAEWIQSAFSYTWVWIASAAVSLLSAAIGMLLTLRPGDPHAEKTPAIHRSVLWSGVVTLFGVFAFNGFLTFAALYAREVGMENAAIVFLVTSATMVFIRVFFGRVPDIVGPIRAGSGALILTVIASVVIAFWSTPTGLIVGAVLVAAGLSLQSPSFIAIAVHQVSDRERGSAMATYTAFYDIAGAIVGPSMGLIVTTWGYREAFLMTGVTSIIGLVILQTIVAPRWRLANA